MEKIKEVVENLHILKIYKKTYETYKSDPQNKDFYDNYQAQIIKYERSYQSLKEQGLAQSKITTFSKTFEKLASDKAKKMEDYEMINSKINECYSLKKTIEQYQEINKKRF